MSTAPNLATTPQGFRFKTMRLELTAQVVARYFRAIGATDGTETNQAVSQFVPPLAVIALALSGLQEQIPLPAGAIHAGQELQTHRVLPVPSVLQCDAVISQRAQRAGWIILSIDIAATMDDDGQPAVSGRTTLLLPDQRAG